MLDKTTRTANGVLRVLTLGLCGFVAACLLPGPVPSPTPMAGPWQSALREVPNVQMAVQPLRGEAFKVVAGSGLLVVGADRDARGSDLDAGQRQMLARFVQEGGRLVLFGDAAQWVADLEIEPELPERGWFRWGFDARTDVGRARVGLRVVSGKQPELFDGLPSSHADDNTVLVAGGAPCRLRRCHWAIGEPRNGHVLAVGAVELDGVDALPGAPLLVHWQHGRGEVLACGVVPELQNSDPVLQAAAAAFVQRCARWAAGKQLVVWTERAAPVEPVPELLPLAPLLPHWGMQEPSLDRARRRVDEVVADSLVGSFEAGADLCVLELTDAEGAASVPWAAQDPLKPVASYRGNSPVGWTRDAVAELSTEAHARSMLVVGGLDPVPAGSGATEQLVALRYLSRELADVRRAGAAALDGFALRQWLLDGKGYGATMLQDFAPAAALLLSGEPTGPFAGGLRALHADDGALHSLPWSGLAGSWRRGFPADEFPFGVLEARYGIDRRRPGRWRGGSAPDWIVAQANEFVRARAGRGGGMWWLCDEGAVAPAALGYVRGVSLEPLRAAVVVPLVATGADGTRAAGASLLEAPPAGYVAGGAATASVAVHVLQNNWLQLAGTGGPLRFDPQGLARFGDGEAQPLSGSFLRSRLFGGRPDGGALRSDQTDFLANGRRPEGDHGPVLRVSAAGERRVPTILAADEQPAWPRTVCIEWNAPPGYHELTIVLRAVRQAGVATVAIDGTVLRALPFSPTAPVQPVTIPVHVSSGALRVLQVQVEHGGACAIDRLEVVRRGDVGVEAAALVPAGSRAILSERAESSYHAERLDVVTQADFAGFVLRLHNDRAVRNLQVERVFALPGYTFVDSVDGEEPTALRQPFLLRAANAAMPDLVVAPLQLSRYEQLRWENGQLSMRSAPEAGACSRIGFLFCVPGEGDRWLPYAGKVLAAVDQPQRLDLEALGEATLVGDLPLATSRVLEIAGRSGAPFAVCEQGWWQWRGSQAVAGGGRWLRVHQAPGDTVRVVGGPSVLARTRPGPGSMRLLALREPTPTSATVRVLQPSRLAPPSVVFATDFDAVTIDGAPWDWFDGRTVFMPDRTATSRVQVQQRGNGERPHVRSTRAPLTTCQYVPERRELVLVTDPATERASELPWTAVVAGPVPVAVENGEIVADASLRLPSAEQAARAAAGGTLIRFRSGTTKVRYGD